MNDYAASLNNIEIREDRLDDPLTREEMWVLRKYVGKLSWLAANTRPYLAVTGVGEKAEEGCVEGSEGCERDPREDERKGE